jgi:hypothetical protein
LRQQVVSAGHRFLAGTWADKAREFEREMEVIRNSIRRMDRLVARSDEAKRAAAAG